MRPAQLLTSLAVVLTGAVLSQAQSPPFTAVVKEAEVEVRAGPGNDPRMYVTNRLRKGESVRVVKDRGDGFFEISPPPGSFSWINMRYVDQTSPNTFVVVVHDNYPAPVRVGSNVVNEKPTIEGAKLKRGSLVVSVGRPEEDKKEGDGSWLPIEPPPSEVRFIRADAVQMVNTSEPPPSAPAAVPPPPAASAPAEVAPAVVAPPNMGVTVGGSGGSGSSTTTTVSNSGQLGNPPAAPVSAPPPAAVPGSPEAMWQEAEQLEKTGRKADAERLYAELGQKCCNDPRYNDLAMKCWNRVHFLKSEQRSTSQFQSGYSTPQRPTGGEVRLSPVPTSANGQPMNYYVNACPGPNQAANYGAPNSPTATLEPQSIGPGVLRLAGRLVDYRRSFALEDPRTREVLMYVTAAQGVDLDSFDNRVVTLYGPVSYRGDLRCNFMTAMRVTPAP